MYDANKHKHIYTQSTKQGINVHTHRTINELFSSWKVLLSLMLHPLDRFCTLESLWFFCIEILCTRAWRFHLLLLLLTFFFLFHYLLVGYFFIIVICVKKNNLAEASVDRVHALEYLNNFSKHCGNFLKFTLDGIELFHLPLVSSNVFFFCFLHSSRFTNEFIHEKMYFFYLVRWMSIKFAT